MCAARATTRIEHRTPGVGPSAPRSCGTALSNSSHEVVQIARATPRFEALARRSSSRVEPPEERRQSPETDEEDDGPRVAALSVSDVMLTVVIDERGRTSFDALSPPAQPQHSRPPPVPLSRRASKKLRPPRLCGPSPSPPT